MAGNRTSPTFLCGELKPGRRNIGNAPPKPPGPIRIIPKPPRNRRIDPPGVPPVPPPGNDPWVCVCDYPCVDDGNACDDPASRRCIKKSTLPAGRRATREFATKADCELRGFGEAPCWVCSYKCEEVNREYCPLYRPNPNLPPIRTIKKIYRDCVRCANGKFAPPGCGFKSSVDCEANCLDETFRCPQEPPTTTSTPGIVITPSGPTTPRSWYGCIEIGREYCENDPNILKVIRRDCRFSTIRGGPYIHRRRQDCDPCEDYVFACPGDPVGRSGPTTGGGPPIGTGTGDLLDGGSGGGNGGGSNTFTSVDGSHLRDQGFGGVTAPGIVGVSVPEDQRDELNIDELDAGDESGGTTRDPNNDTLYDPNYNIFSHPAQTLDEIEFVSNNKYLEIFKTIIPKSIAYVLERSGNSISDWDEFYYTQITPEIIAISLKPSVLDVFRNINDETNQRVSLVDLLTGLGRYILLGKMSKFDMSVFLKAKVRQNEKTLVINRSTDQGVNQRAALGLISDQAYPYDRSQYPLDQQPYISRLKALLTDIHAKVTIFDKDKSCSEEFNLQDAGIPVDEECFIGEGNGDNYYIASCEDQGINLTTDKDRLYFLPYTTKQVALNILGQDFTMDISASAPSGKSEVDDNYDLSSGIGPMYFALKPETIRMDSTGDEFITISTANYELLTSGEARTHSDTYGLMATVANIDYDDPMLMYAKTSSSIEFRGPDITFRSFDEGVGFGYDILPRQIPRAIVIQPVSSCQENPFYGLSELTSFSETKVRTIKMQPHFNPEARWPLQAVLSNEDYPNFQVGFSGVLDTQNVIFQYNPSSFNSLEGNRTNPIVKKIVKDLITDQFDANYILEFLTWHDLWSRINARELAEMFHNESSRFRQELMNGTFGPTFIHVLNRPGAAKTGLNEIKPSGTPIAGLG